MTFNNENSDATENLDNIPSVNKESLSSYDTPELSEAFSALSESVAQEEKIRSKFPWKTIAFAALLLTIGPLIVIKLFF